MVDNFIWNTIGGRTNTCAFKKPTQHETFCKHPNNVTKLCTAESCPLANHKYATIREINDKLYLFLKEPERFDFVDRQYEQIELPADYDEAISLIDEELMFFSDFLKHKCKQRLTILFEYLIRKKSRNKNVVEYTVQKRRQLKKDLRMADRTKRALNVEKEVEKELLVRMKAGVYGNEVKDVLIQRTTAVNNVVKERTFDDFEESDEILSVKELKKRKDKNYNW